MSSEPVPRELLEALAAELVVPAPAPGTTAGTSTSSFDVPGFLQKHDIAVKRHEDYRGGHRYIVECPFNDDHGQGTDTAVLQLASGAVVFKCQHNGCADKRWADFRAFYEPDGTPPPAAPAEGDAPPHPYTIRSLADFMALKVPERKAICMDVLANDPILREGDIAMLHAWRGRGKSIAMADLALAITSAARSLRWAASDPRNVLYIDGELPAAMIQERFAALGLARGLGLTAPRVPVARLGILSALTEEWGITSLSTPEGQARLEPYLDLYDVLMFDHLSALFPGAGPENDAVSWDRTQEWLIKLRRWGKTSVFAHHDGKGGAQRGTSHREDVLDLVIGLREPKDDEREGTHFEWHFEKHRSVYGAAVQPFEAHLVTDRLRGTSTWTVVELEDPTLAEIIELKAAGSSTREIARKLKIDHTTVMRRLARAGKRGLL